MEELGNHGTCFRGDAGAICGLATPILSHLMINVCHYLNSSDTDMVLRIILLPMGPLLREVVWGVVTLDWSCPQIVGLCILHLHALNEGRPRLLELHQVLSNSPGLEFFSLYLGDQAWMPKISPKHHQTSRSLTFPHS